MERVLAAGYRRPGLLTLKRQENSMVKLHIAAFLAYQNELAPENRVGLMNGDSMEGEAIRAWFDEHRPDVILTTNFPAQLHFEEAGIRVPQDVALVSLLRWDEQVGIAGVRPGFERLGTVAVNILVSMLQHDERGEPVDRTTVELEGRWVDGESMPLAQSRKPKARSVVKSRRPG
jgi:DNA-binding LacI/PurR family transcriptional regulator